MSGMNKLPLISLSVPVYGTESTLPHLLDSLLGQTVFANSPPEKADCFYLELIIINDGSPTGASLPEIVKLYKKSFKKIGVSVVLLEHRKNRGIFEARRTCVMTSSAPFMLFADPDDTLPSDALQRLYAGALASGGGSLSSAADIIHGKMALYMPRLNSIGIEGEKAKACHVYDRLLEAVQAVHPGRLSGTEVLENFLVAKEHSGFLCAKLFRTELLRRTYEKMPHTFCIMAEDLLLYFFVLQQQPSYYGIGDIVYNYNNDTGITGDVQITGLERWEKICSTASVFALIFSYIQENPIDECCTDSLRRICNTYLAGQLRQLNACVVPQLQGKAYDMLCDYWGEDYVKRVEAAEDGSSVPNFRH